MATAVVLLIYGLSFLALGVVVSIRLRAASKDLSGMAASLPWLAAFAFVHGVLEWMQLVNAVRGDQAVPAALQAAFLLASYLLLLEFGRRLVRDSLPAEQQARRRLLDARLHLPLLAAVLAGTALAPGDAAQNAAILSRYLVGTLASALAGIGFLRYAPSAHSYWLGSGTFRLAGAAFLLYGVFGGLVVAHAPWMPAVWLDEDSFKAVVQAPVQLFRAGCAAAIALTVGSTLFRDARLREKILLLTTGIVVVIMAVDLGIGLRTIDAGIRAELTRDARDIRAMLMATRRVYHQQFISSGLPVNDATVGFLPAHAMSRISREFPSWSRSGLSFNNVTDKPRNPANQADRFELAAMEFFRANPKDDERLVDIRDVDGQNYYHYTAPIWIEPYCLQCHGARADAPKSIAQGYDAAYDYHLGDLRGVMSIKLPTKPLEDREYGAWFTQIAMRFAGYTLLTLLLVFFLNRVVTSRLARVASATAKLAAGDYSARSPVAADDEISRLSRSFNAMGDEIQDRDRRIHDLLDERLRVIDELRESKENLEQTVAARTAELQQRARQLEAVNAELESFSYSVSHDLRTPLRALDGYARILIEEEAGRLGAESREMLDRIMVNSNRMATLIDDILQFSRIGRADINWQEADMAALARSVADELRGEYPAATLRIGALPPMHGDPAMLRQVWANLIGNALKFSSRKPQPEVDIDSELVNGETVFRVRDNGDGFDMAYAGKLFGVFQRLHSEKDFPGTGAGLAIVKRIVERHGGRIWADAEPGKGAAFRFTLAG